MDLPEQTLTVDPAYEQNVEKRAGLEKTDSCYDSDDHEDDANLPRNLRNIDPAHRDVSRTVSETLKEEYSDHQNISTISHHLNHLNSNKEIYHVHLAFALKLGYSEAQVQKALQKLGSVISQNELLAELIKLGSATKSEHDPENNHIIDSNKLSENIHQSADNLLLPRSIDSPLRHIVVDGSNVAMCHGCKVIFSCRGILLCVEYFRQRGHQDITVFVPQWRKELSKPDAPITDQEILLQLERERILTFTPSRYIGKKRLVCYDDRYCIKLAVETDGIIVSNDTYRDLLQEHPDYRRAIEERLLMFSFVNDRFMPPDDPLGRHGPTLAQFLRKANRQLTEGQQLRPCPYGKKCTYGNKCKFAHPERGNLPQRSVTEMIGEGARVQLQEIQARELEAQYAKLKLTATHSSPAQLSPSTTHKRPLSRTRSVNPGLWQRGPNPTNNSNMQPQNMNMNMFSHSHNNISSNRHLLDPSLYWTSNQGNQISRPTTAAAAAAGGRYSLSPLSNNSGPTSNIHNPLHHSYHSSFSDLHSLYDQPPPSFSRLHHPPLCQANSDSQVKGMGRMLSRIEQSPQMQASEEQFFSTPDYVGSTTNSQSLGRELFDSRSMFNLDAQRYDLYKKMSALFPQQQVQIVLECYPQETNVQKLCSALMAMFPDAAAKD